MMKMNKPLTTARVAYKNLTGKPGRAATLVAVVAIMAFVFFGGAFLSQSLDNGITSLQSRLGADIAIVPYGSENAYESIILAGTPIGFHLDRDIAWQISGIAGVEQVTTQFFLATMANAACCTIQAQIIGIDFDTDFVVTPWITQLLNRQIGDGEVIVGSNVNIGNSSTITFFHRTFDVAARLERTATGLDSTVFVNMEIAQELARMAQTFGFFPRDTDLENTASVILVNVNPAYEKSEILADIRANVQNVSIVESYGIYSGMAANLRVLTRIIGVVTVAAAILSALVLAALFSLISNGRKKEFAVLRILGATRKKLASIVLAEAFDISLLGAASGCVAAALVVFPFGRHIGAQMGMPFLLPDAHDSVLIFVSALILSIAIGPLSSAYSAYKISRAETYATMREGE